MDHLLIQYASQSEKPHTLEDFYASCESQLPLLDCYEPSAQAILLSKALQQALINQRMEEGGDITLEAGNLLYQTG